MDPGSAAHRKWRCAASGERRRLFTAAESLSGSLGGECGVTGRITPTVVMGGFVIAKAAEIVIARFGCLLKVVIRLSTRWVDPPCPLARKTGTVAPDESDLASPVCKNISLVPSGKSSLQAAPSCSSRGALRNVNNVEQDAVDAGSARDESAGSRTAKSCGSDASTPASSQRWQHHWRR